MEGRRCYYKGCGTTRITNDREHILQILTNGYPSELVWEETAQNKETFIKRGNNPSIKANFKEVIKVLNQEEQNHHRMVLPRWMYRGYPYPQSTPRTVIMKSNKQVRFIWDSFTKLFVWETIMNEVTDMENEAIINFGYK